MSPITTYPDAIPEGYAAYFRTPEFNENSLPAGLRKDHATKAGVWALIHVLEGKLRYCVPSWNYDQVLEPGTPGIVAPEIEHFVEPVGTVRMVVEFYAQPEQEPDNPHSKMSE